MSALSDVLAAAKAEGRAALVGYLPAGYPSVPGAVDAMVAMVRGGVDVVEVGLPYSDPLMDGPTIQCAVEIALEQGTTTGDVLTTVRGVAATGAPTLVMSYWNPLERYGALRFAEDLAAAGGAGTITPDLTPDEASTEPSDWLGATDATGLDRVFLVAPSSTDERIRWTAAALPRLRLRRLHHGCHRRPHLGGRGGRHPGGAGARADRRSPCASVSACRTVTRPPRSRPSPTASSSARRSSARCSTPGRPAMG